MRQLRNRTLSRAREGFWGRFPGRFPCIPLCLIPLSLLIGDRVSPPAFAGAPGVQREVASTAAILIGQTPPVAQTYIGQASLIFVDAKDWKPLRIAGELPKIASLTTGTLMYEADPRYEPQAKIMSFVAAAPISTDAIRQRA